MRGRSILIALVVAATSLLATPAHASFPGSNGAIAFTRWWHIWTVQPDGTQAKLAAGWAPSWSPDGARIAYVHANRGVPNIWTMAADGSDKIRLTRGGAFRDAPSWSPDGTRIVYILNHDIVTVDADTPFDDPTSIAETPDLDEDNPRWSPDGTRIAFDVLGCEASCSWRIGVVDVDGGTYSFLTSGSTSVEPDWSLDSTTLLFGSDLEGKVNVYSIPAAGGAMTPVLSGADGGRNGSPVWSPDGLRFAYVHEGAGGTSSLRTASADGSSSVRIARGWPNFYEFGPDWQPRG